MSSPADTSQWRFFRFGLLVTGRGEEAFLPDLFRSLAATGQCTFQVIRRVNQRSPITSPKRKLPMPGSDKPIPAKDVEEIGFPARRYLDQKGDFVLLVDDLEEDRASKITEVFQRYRDAIDTVLGSRKHRASVHFLVNMLEAYFFADANAINAVLGTDLTDFDGDVETIRNPKGELNRLKPGYDEIEHGRQIIVQLDVPHVLSRVDTCAALRTMFGWCSKAMSLTPTDLYQLLNGKYNPVTKPQIDDLQSGEDN